MYLVSSVQAVASASVAISTVPFFVALAASHSLKSSQSIDLALLLSALSAINSLSASVKLVLSVNLDGFIWLGAATVGAQLHPVSVPAAISASVANSTLPATVWLAAGVVQLEKVVHAHHTYWFNAKSAVLYITIPLIGLVIAASLAVSSAYVGNGCVSQSTLLFSASTISFRNT